MKIYTKTGDSGQTSLRWGSRIAKDALRVEAYGSVDETNAFVGMAVAALPAGDAGAALPAGGATDQLRTALLRVQRELFDLGADLAVPPARDKGEQPKVTEAMVTAMEADIDQLETGLEPLRTFILPGGDQAGAALHIARTVSRRAERRVVSLAAAESVDPVLIRYLNRLSDFLFVAARSANKAAGTEDVKVEWKKGQ